MLSTSPALESLITAFSRLPGIGRKTAQRMALFTLRQPRNEVEELITALQNVLDRVRSCSTCFNITETDPCAICSSTRRNHGLVCVVEEPNDVFAIERTNDYKGVYHVLGGTLAPLDGIGPEDLRVRELIERVKKGTDEVILALNPTVEGEATTHYLSQLLTPLGIKVTRIARGIPVGADLEFADDATLVRALEGRIPV